MRRAAHWLAWWVALVVLWQLFVSTFAAPEVLAGLLAAAVSATAAEAVRGQNLVHFHPRARWFVQAYRLPGNVVRDCLVLGRVLWRRVVRREPIEGDFIALAFSPGGDDPQAAGARRALYVAAISLTPNTFVVGIDRDNDVMLIHQLVPTDPTDARELLFPP